MISSKLAAIISMIILAGVAGCSLSADVTPPPGYVPPTPETPAPVKLTLPSATLELPGGSGSNLSVTPSVPLASTSGQSQPTPSSQQQAQAGGLTGKVAIEGRVVNATNVPLPTGLKVVLQGFNGMQPEMSWSADIRADGSFLFPDVKASNGWVYVASVDYGQVTFNSDIIHGNDLLPGQTYSTMVTIYETSSDISSLIIDRMHVILDFSKPGLVQVVELFIISNPTNQVIVPVKDGQPLLKFNLPSGANNLQFQGGGIGDRFVQTATGFGDMQSIVPGRGQQQVLFAYDLPYRGSAAVSLTAPLPVAAVVVMLPSDSGIQLQSSQLQYAGQKAAQGMNLDLYTTTDLASGSSLPITIVGDGQWSSGAGGLSEKNLIFGLIVFALVLAAVAIYFVSKRYEHRKVALEAGSPVAFSDGPSAASTENLLDAIITLDDMHQAGELADEVYQNRRAELKKKLKQTLH